MLQVFNSVHKPKTTVCGVSTGRDISFVRNNLKWFHSCLTHMHYSMNDRINTEVFLFCHSLKSMLFRYNVLRSIFVLKITLKTIYSDYSW